ncbi:hypothetical protein MC7420_822 [Coleofasciculus chthonoplastes PCC 7420]|uniref:Uncharacterized protein n=1 Tax=Coleofasciculus chthonoplastes PCC 7420 TaxID=118168 RepID=B4VSS9_9CYAN|nr:hypothetical protein MC7420_822 [Coleofasciculus chthonoplastes PCC 7420]
MSFVHSTATFPELEIVSTLGRQFQPRPSQLNILICLSPLQP